AAAALRVGGTMLEEHGITLVDFDTGTSAMALRMGTPDAAQWNDRLPDLDGFDLVVSDNLPEVLARRPDAVLMGNFLWHEVIEGCDAAYVARARALLAQHRPSMIASTIFAAPYLSGSTRLQLVGLFGPPVRQTTRGDDLLVAIGHGGEAAS